MFEMLQWVAKDVTTKSSTAQQMCCQLSTCKPLFDTLEKSHNKDWDKNNVQLGSEKSWINTQNKCFYIIKNQ